MNRSKLYYILIQGLTKSSLPIHVPSQKSCLVCEYKYSIRISLLCVQYTFLVSRSSTGFDLLLSIPVVILLDFSRYFFLYACQPWTDSDFIDHVIKTQ